MLPHFTTDSLPQDYSYILQPLQSLTTSTFFFSCVPSSLFSFPHSHFPSLSYIIHSTVSLAHFFFTMTIPIPTAIPSTQTNSPLYHLYSFLPIFFLPSPFLSQHYPYHRHHSLTATLPHHATSYTCWPCHHYSDTWSLVICSPPPPQHNTFLEPQCLPGSDVIFYIYIYIFIIIVTWCGVMCFSLTAADEMPRKLVLLKIMYIKTNELDIFAFVFNMKSV